MKRTRHAHEIWLAQVTIDCRASSSSSCCFMLLGSSPISSILPTNDLHQASLFATSPSIFIRSLLFFPENYGFADRTQRCCIANKPNHVHHSYKFTLLFHASHLSARNMAVASQWRCILRYGHRLTECLARSSDTHSSKMWHRCTFDEYSLL